MDEFDYIIIGGGSAGCVLANRLSTNEQDRVCLLEAGPPDTNLFIHIPLGIMFVIRNENLNWKFWTVPQENCANRRLFWPRGKTLGGSSAINAMCYSRGNPADYDHWATLGNTAWSYQDVLPYFKKCENFEPFINDFHHLGGPLNIAAQRCSNPLLATFLNAANEAHYELVDDFTSATQLGVGKFFVMQENGQRASNAHAYLHPVMQRKNLTVINHAHIARILFSKQRAFAVRYYHHHQTIEIKARKEIILAAGTIGSPQLLMLSGIGPRDELTKHHLPIIHELPGVGKNLQDHLDIHICTLEKTHHALSFHPRSLWRNIKNIFHYFINHHGELTSNIAEGCGFISSHHQSIPDWQWHFLPTVETHHARHLSMMMKYAYTLKTCLLHPYSRGEITLASTDPLQAPLINPRYLSDQRDLDMLVLGFKKARELLAKPAFAVHRLYELQPGDQVQTDDEIKNYIREYAETIYHPVGSCKMGNDVNAVVNAQLQVYGVTGLRVVDASIMPTIISGNTNVPVTMIAEKAADMILQNSD